MRIALLASSLVALLGALTAPAANAAVRPEVDAAARAVNPQVIAWRRDFHQFPELSNREERTSAKVAEALRKLGLKPRIGIAHRGVVAIIEGGLPGPKLALRADMDALPVTERNGLPFASKVTTTFNGQATGVMHACGHDAHTAILLGVAQSLMKMRAQLPGQVMLVFQPSEEGAPTGEKGGASLMLEEGLFRDFKPDAIFGLHVFSTVPVGQIAVRPGPILAASDRFAITVHGRQTHGARPWGGVDPIVAASEIVTSSQSIVSRRTNISALPVVVSFGAINGGIRYNIIPDDVKLIGTIRTFDATMRDKVLADLKNVSEHVAAANGATVDAQVPDMPGNPVLINNAALTLHMLPSLRAAVGDANVIESPLQMIAEDFAYFSREVPAMYFLVGSTAKGLDPQTVPGNHSPGFMLDEGALDVGVRAMLQATLDFLDMPKAS